MTRSTEMNSPTAASPAKRKTNCTSRSSREEGVKTQKDSLPFEANQCVVKETPVILQTETKAVEQEVKPNKRARFKSYNRKLKKTSDQEIHYDLFEHIGSIGSSHNGWLREVNILSWNDAAPGLDIRHWSEDHRKMSRGINLSLTESENLRVLLSAVDLTAYEDMVNS